MAFYILNNKSGYVLDIANNQGKVILYKSNGGNTQLWTVNDGVIQTQSSEYAGYVLEGNGQKVKASPRQAGNPNQKWTFLTDGTVRNEKSGYILDFQNVQKQNGEPEALVIASQQHCENGCAGQKFQKFPIARE